MKKSIYILVMLLVLSAISVMGAPNLTSVQKSNAIEFRFGAFQFGYGATPRFDAVYEGSNNITLLCTQENNFDECKINTSRALRTTECFSYSVLNDSASPVATTLGTLPAGTQGTVNYRCHICDSHGICDNSSFNTATLYQASGNDINILSKSSADFILFRVLLTMIAGFAGISYSMTLAGRETQNLMDIIFGVIAASLGYLISLVFTSF